MTDFAIVSRPNDRCARQFFAVPLAAAQVFAMACSHCDIGLQAATKCKLDLKFVLTTFEAGFSLQQCFADASTNRSKGKIVDGPSQMIDRRELEETGMTPPQRYAASMAPGTVRPDA